MDLFQLFFFIFQTFIQDAPIKWAIILAWVLTGILWVLTFLGIVNQVEESIPTIGGIFLNSLQVLYLPWLWLSGLGLICGLVGYYLEDKKGKIRPGETPLSVYNFRYVGDYLCSCKSWGSYGNKPSISSTPGDVPGRCLNAIIGIAIIKRGFSTLP